VAAIKELDLPSDDKRWKIVQGTMRRNGFREDALIETLHTVQQSFGYLDEESLAFVAKSLNVAPSRVMGVATFYHFFQLKPAGEHVCSVCTGTACYIKGAKDLLKHLETELDLRPGETTEDGLLSLLTVRCVGACSVAPAVVLDGDVMAEVTPEVLDEQVERLKQHDDNA